jgi:hypothetical protein
LAGRPLSATARRRYNARPSASLSERAESKMNRQKKLQQLFKAKAKKASAKLAPKKKTTYVSKADRAKLEAEAQAAAEPTPPTVERP